jgi:hypothetical protein
MQNTKFVVVQGQNVVAALDQAEKIFRSVFAEIDCQVQNVFVVPEAVQTRFQDRPVVITNLVIVLVAAPGVTWPESAVQDANGQVEGMKAIKE